jgi:DNA modification methylase
VTNGFAAWTNGRPIESLGTNAGSESLPFQDWRRFKEAFAPELVERAVQESGILVNACIDPFGGSGTTALACQFLGVRPITIEVNPFLADLIAAKLSAYLPSRLERELNFLQREAQTHRRRPGPLFKNAPATFLEPGINGRWIFDFEVATRIASILGAIKLLADGKYQRFFKVILGGILVDISNVITSGKGRRYRQKWSERPCDPDSVMDMFVFAARSAIDEVRKFSTARRFDHSVICGDARRILPKVSACDLAVLSPPYPNSFDYTDVYNLELWTLGYLSDGCSNRRLRKRTLSSHVQILRDFSVAPESSQRLNGILRKLRDARDDLWSPYIPEMVGAYFADMNGVLRELKRIIVRGGSVWIVAGDSQYLDCRIRTSEILADLALTAGWEVDRVERFRSMRFSAQQGGERALAENLLVLRNG